MKTNRLVLLLFAAIAWSATATAQQKVKNVIFMVGDGMGIAHVTATAYANSAPLNFERAQYCGFVKTYSANNRITDSAAAATAMACGVKTNNRTLGVDTDKNPVPSILERCAAQGFATGLVAVSSITNATPAGYISHVDSRGKEEDIASQFLNTDITLFMGGGNKFFREREDGRDIAAELEAKGYGMFYSLPEALAYNGSKMGVLMAEKAMKTMLDGRGDFLPQATVKTLDFLKSRSSKGFFVMIEGSFIDGGGHQNNIDMVMAETVDFDQAVGKAFDFADKNPGTLVIVTADHETGGLALVKSESGAPYDAGFNTTGHSATFVPLFAYGTGAQNFSRVMENTDLPKEIAKLMGVKW